MSGIDALVIHKQPVCGIRLWHYLLTTFANFCKGLSEGPFVGHKGVFPGSFYYEST